MRTLTFKKAQLLFPLLLSTLLVAGCSENGAGSTVSNTESISGTELLNNNTASLPVRDDAAVPADTSLVENETSGIANTTTDSEETNFSSAVNESTEFTAIESNATNTNTNTTETNAAETSSTETVSTPQVEAIPEESVIQFTDIAFDITVPAYASDSLSIIASWSGEAKYASWVIDETWSVDARFTANSEHWVNMKFYESDGRIQIAEASFMVETSNSPTQVVRVNSHQFDTNQFDYDGDGISNYIELVSGTDPSGIETAAPQPVENNDILLDFLPSTVTSLFGQPIETVPNPDFIFTDRSAWWDYEIVGDQLFNPRFEPLPAHKVVWQQYVDMTLPENRESIELVQFHYALDGSDTIYTQIGHYSRTPGDAKVEIEFPERFTTEVYAAHNQSLPRLERHSLRYLRVMANAFRASQIILTYEEYDFPTYALGYLNKVHWDSPLRSFYQGFWEGERYDAWQEASNNRALSSFQSTMMAENPEDFVSRVAAYSPNVDFSNTFGIFVTMDDMPAVGEVNGTEKIRWFWNQPEFVQMRDYARSSL